MRALSLSVLAFVSLAACSNSEGSFLSSGTIGGPDPTTVVPRQPLQTPPSFTLPQPTPGGTNRSDPTAEALAARNLAPEESESSNQ